MIDAREFERRIDNTTRIEKLKKKIEALEKQVEELKGEKKRHDIMETAISALNAEIDQNSTVHIEIDTQAMAKNVAKKLHNAIMNGNITDYQIENFVKVLDRIRY